MDLSYTEFQELLRQTARDFGEREGLVARHRERAERGATFDAETWRRMADLGWLGLVVPEAHGGSGGSWADVTVLLEELGRALAPSHVLAHTLAGLVIQAYGTDDQRRALLPRVVQGDPVFAVALTEPRATLDEAGIQCAAREETGGLVLNGTKHFVRGAGAADTLVVLARLADGLGLVVLDQDAPGIEGVALPNIGDDDQQRITLTDVRVGRDALLGGGPQGWGALSRIVDMGALLECAYGVGIMARDTEMTINYVTDRVQFGRPIGSFQAVQHQVADQVTDVDCGRYLTHYAAWEMDLRAPTAPTAVARAKAWVSDALRRVVRTGNQLHGGIGFSREYDIHFYYQRGKMSELMFGAADHHRERIAAALLDS